MDLGRAILSGYLGKRALSFAIPGEVKMLDQGNKHAAKMAIHSITVWLNITAEEYDLLLGTPTEIFLEPGKITFSNSAFRVKRTETGYEKTATKYLEALLAKMKADHRIKWDAGAGVSENA